MGIHIFIGRFLWVGDFNRPWNLDEMTKPRSGNVIKNLRQIITYKVWYDIYKKILILEMPPKRTSMNDESTFTPDEGNICRST